MPMGYWNWPVRPKGDFPQIVLSVRLLEKQRNSWGNCYCRMWNGRRMVRSGLWQPGPFDPEMRHGRKSSSKRFDGHKDTDSQLVTAGHSARQCCRSPGTGGAGEENTGIAVEETIGMRPMGMAGRGRPLPMPVGR